MTTKDKASPADEGRLQRGVSLLDPERSFRLWRECQPYGGATEKEHRAFIAGFKAALNPEPLTRAELLSVAVEYARELGAKRQALIESGKCPDCEGAGEVGGQFSGGYMTCPTCGGSGKPQANVMSPSR